MEHPIRHWMSLRPRTLAINEYGRSVSTFNRISTPVLSEKLYEVKATAISNASIPDTSYRNVGKYRELPGNTITQIPEGIIEALGAPIDFDTLLGDSVTNNLPVHTSSNEHTRYELQVDTRNSISFFGPEEEDILRPVLSELKNIPVFELEDLFRGSGPVKVVRKPVTGSQILDGKRFFLYKRKLLAGSSEEGIAPLVDTYMVCLGIFEPLASFFRFKKSTLFLGTMVDCFIENKLNMFLDYETYSKKSQSSSPWWNQLPADAVPAVIPDTSVEALQKDSNITERHLKLVASINAPVPQEIASNFVRLQRQLSGASDNINNIKHAIEANKSSVDSTRVDIESYTQRIAAYKRKLEEREQDIRLKESALVDSKQAFEAIQSKYNSVSDAYLKAKEHSQREILDKDTNYIENFLKAGVVVKNVYCYDKNTRRRYKIAEHSTLPPDTVVDGIEFDTIEPTVIEAGSVHIAAGPYSVLVRNDNGNPTLQIKPLSAHSIVGFTINGQTLLLKAHPHMATASVHMHDFSLWCQEWRTVCLGEGAPALIHAFNSSSIMNIVLVVMTWLKSCNVRDAYGAHYTMFPKASTVNLKRTPIDTSASEPTDFQRRLEYTQDGSSKFWSIRVEGTTYITRWGRIGTEGRTHTNYFATNSEATTAAQAACRSKIDSGYVDVTSSVSAPTQSETSAEPAIEIPF
jgi:predicted DNA-binding WGR domain protein